MFVPVRVTPPQEQEGVIAIAERAIRPITIGRRNYLTFSSDTGGAIAAALYSLVGTEVDMSGLDRSRSVRHEDTEDESD